MSRLRYLLVAGAFMFTTAVFAQQAGQAKAKETPIKITKFEAGKKLNTDDLGFLDLIYNSEGGKSHGGHGINIGGHHAHAEHTLADAEAREISKKIEDYTNTNKPEERKSSGDAHCYSYCYTNAGGNFVCYEYCY